MTIEEINKRYSELNEQGKLVKEFLDYGKDLYFKNMSDSMGFDFDTLCSGRYPFVKSAEERAKEKERKQGFLDKWAEYENRKKEIQDEYVTKKVEFCNQLLESGYSKDVAYKIAGISVVNGKETIVIGKD